MIAGLPGTGLGGIFYILAALVVVAREGVHWLRGESSRQRLRAAARLAIMTLLILIVLWGTYWLLDQVFVVSVNLPVGTTVNQGTPVPHQTIVIPTLLVATLPMQLAILAAILGSVEVISWLLKRRS